VDACRPDGWDVYQYDEIVSGIEASMTRDTVPRIDYPCPIFGIPFFCSGLAEEEISGEGQAYNAEGQLWLGISSIVRAGLRGQVSEDLEGGLFADIMDTVKISINIGEKGAFLEGEAFNTQIEVRLPGYVYVLASQRAAFKLGWETAKRIAVRETWGSGYRFVRSVPDVVPHGSNGNPRLVLSALQLRGYQIKPWPKSEFSQY
jgi:hypothetical protein